jgi:hypothetical protein
VEPLLLVKNNVPFDVAFAMDRTMRLAAIIVFGRMEGGHWDWERMCWREER